jgi:hypothetical protein
MPELAAQITAPESVPQTEPTCDHCGSAIMLLPIDRDCCHRHTADIHALGLDSARQTGRYVIWLTKRMAILEERIMELETRATQRKAKG